MQKEKPKKCSDDDEAMSEKYKRRQANKKINKIIRKKTSERLERIEMKVEIKRC